MSDGMKDASRGNHFADLDRPNNHRLAGNQVEVDMWVIESFAHRYV
jgi:hypothetical protein